MSFLGPLSLSAFKLPWNKWLSWASHFAPLIFCQRTQGQVSMGGTLCTKSPISISLWVVLPGILLCWNAKAITTEHLYQRHGLLDLSCRKNLEETETWARGAHDCCDRKWRDDSRGSSESSCQQKQARASCGHWTKRHCCYIWAMNVSSFFSLLKLEGKLSFKLIHIGRKFSILQDSDYGMVIDDCFLITKIYKS